MNQHTFSLLTATAFGMLAPQIARPTSEVDQVLANDGSLVEVTRLHGGFVWIGSRILSGVTWIAVLGCGIDTAFAEFRQALVQAGQQTGTPVGVEVATIDDLPGTEDPDISQLDEAVSDATLTSVNAWLTGHGFDAIAPLSRREMVVSVFSLFRAGFEIGQDSVS